MVILVSKQGLTGSNVSPQFKPGDLTPEERDKLFQSVIRVVSGTLSPLGINIWAMPKPGGPNEG